MRKCRIGSWPRCCRFSSGRSGGRAAEFEKALQYCDAGLAAAEVPEFVRKILEFERALVLARDTSCHNVGEIEGTVEDAQGTVH